MAPKSTGGKALLRDLLDAVRGAKAGYDAGNKYAKLRLRDGELVQIFGLFGLDVVLTLLAVLVVAGPSLNVTAWYEEGFPSNLVVIQNNGRVLSDVAVVMDGKYTAQIEELEAGATGLEIDRQFRGPSDTAPERTYKPRSVEIRAGSSRVVLELAQKK